MLKTYCKPQTLHHKIGLQYSIPKPDANPNPESKTPQFLNPTPVTGILKGTLREPLKVPLKGTLEGTL